jgi:REP element-mobilizing transposase RayT
MSNNLSIIWLHAIWSTKDRKRILTKDFRFKVFRHIKENAERHRIQLDIINGVEDHVHCLFRLRTTQNPAEVIQHIKGESSHWINKNVILDENFEWQEGYGIFSVSHKDVMSVRKYIYNQEKHHRTNSFAEEIKKMMPNRMRD